MLAFLIIPTDDMEVRMESYNRINSWHFKFRMDPLGRKTSHRGNFEFETSQTRFMRKTQLKFACIEVWFSKETSKFMLLTFVYRNANLLNCDRYSGSFPRWMISMLLLCVRNIFEYFTYYIIEMWKIRKRYLSSVSFTSM